MILWILVRLTATFTMAGDNPMVLPPKASLIVIAVAGFLSRLDTGRRNEDLLLANLGTSRAVVYLLCFGPALAFEFWIGVIGRL